MDWYAYIQPALHIPADWLIIIVFAIFASFDALRSGPGKEVALALAFPLALTLHQMVPSAALLSQVSAQLAAPLPQAALIGAITFVLAILIYRMTAGPGDRSVRPLQALIAGSALTVVLVIVWLQFVPLQSLWHFGTSVTAVFGGMYRFWWLLAAYIALAFARR